MDVLTDVLARLRFRGDLYFTAELGGAWGVRLPPERRSIRFHLVVRGRCRVAVDGGEEASILREGEFVLIPHGAGQVLSGSRHALERPLEEILRGAPFAPDGVLRYRANGRGAECRLICGFCEFDHHAGHPLFRGLPSLIVMDAGAIAKLPWLADAIRVTTIEANRGAPGAGAIVSRLIEILFMQAVRAETASPTAPASPFLRALDDSRLAAALEAMHGEPDRAWTLGSLAKEAGMSRTQFARRFKDALQQAPLEYLTGWRFATARQLLRDTDLAVAEIAARAGYRSVPSFTRRFKQRFDVTPAAYRRVGPGAAPSLELFSATTET